MAALDFVSMKASLVAKGGYPGVTPNDRQLQDLRDIINAQYTERSRAGVDCYGHTAFTTNLKDSLGDYEAILPKIMPFTCSCQNYQTACTALGYIPGCNGQTQCGCQGYRSCGCDSVDDPYCGCNVDIVCDVNEPGWCSCELYCGSNSWWVGCSSNCGCYNVDNPCNCNNVGYCSCNGMYCTCNNRSASGCQTRYG